jgi:PBP1b-binding outer membrane lipoprotein LpoB
MYKRLLVVWLALIVVGCSKSEALPQDVDKAAEVFFERVKSAEYDAIYNEASDQFKTEVARATAIDNLKQVSAMGRIQSFNRLSMKLEGDEKNRMVSPVYNVLFDKARAEITVNFKDDGGDWKLVGFSVKPRSS